MPRPPRYKSDSGIYHIMIRGVNKMNLFQYKYEKLKFLEIVSRMKSQQEYLLYAYCIMDNHAHLLLKEEMEPVSMSMKRIAISYSYYYNKKEDRVGPVFQGRFRSEAIDNDAYLLECIRYIHNNPVKAHMVSNPSDYKFSSYNIYINEDKDELELIDSEFPISMFSEDKTNALKQFVEFSNAEDNGDLLDVDVSRRAIENILENYNYTIESLLKHKDIKQRNLLIKEIKDNTSLSVRKISEVTGLSKDVIHRA
ncbi:MAG: transposase [Tissierellaceae bacterium]|nr:transposase [Tissierellaceae bacterium]